MVCQATDYLQMSNSMHNHQFTVLSRFMALPEMYGGCHATKYLMPIIKVRGCHDVVLTLSMPRLRLAGAQGAAIAPTLRV